MKRSLGIVLILVLAAVFTGANGLAVPVTVQSDVTLSGTALNGKAAEATVAAFELLGREAEEYIVYADGQMLKLSAETLLAAVPSVERVLADLPDAARYEPMQRGAKGDAVTALQNKLIDLGYLAGTADGDFGGKTQKALARLQKEKGLKQTGAADVYTQMLIDALDHDTLAAAAQADLAERFASIAGKTEANLAAAQEQGLDLEFDDIAGVGFISNGNSLAYAVPAEADIDQCEFTLRFGLRVTQGDDGMVAVEPALLVDSLSVRRPILREVTLKSGDERYTVPVSLLSSGISGIQSRESAVVLLDRGVADMLANAAGEGELKLRLGCKYDSYDIEVPADTLAAISRVGAAAQGL